LVHADNTCPHTAKASRDFVEAYGMEKAHHLPYSSNLTPSDFYRFGHVKNRFAGASFADANELVEAIMTVLGEIEKMILEAIFLEWMDRFRRCITTNGEYIG
jgi:histone-lysine N-methyltransferase SETMAR